MVVRLVGIKEVSVQFRIGAPFMASMTFKVLDKIRRLRIVGKFDAINSYVLKISQSKHKIRVKWGVVVATTPYADEVPNRILLKDDLIQSLIPKCGEAEAKKSVERYYK